MKKGIFVVLSMGNFVYAGTPLWTFTPLTATSVTVPSNSSKTVQYTITNQSKKTHTLVMNTIKGVIQDTSAGNCSNPFTLASQQSCRLSLTIYGNQMTGDIYEGPVVCEQLGLNLQCYRPHPNDILNAMLSSAKNTFAYITNQQQGGIGFVSVCNYDSNTGALNACIDTGNGFATPTGIAFQQDYAYISSSAVNF